MSRTACSRTLDQEMRIRCSGCAWRNWKSDLSKCPGIVKMRLRIDTTGAKNTQQNEQTWTTRRQIPYAMRRQPPS